MKTSSKNFDFNAAEKAHAGKATKELARYSNLIRSKDWLINERVALQMEEVQITTSTTNQPVRIADVKAKLS